MDVVNIMRMCGWRVLGWLVVGSATGLCLGFIELLFSFTIQLLLSALGYVSADAQVVPSWFPTGNLSPQIVLFVLCGIGLARSIAVFFSGQSALIANETMAVRLRLMAVHGILRSKNKALANIAENNNRFSEIFPKASAFVDGLARSIPLVMNLLVLTFFMVYYAPRESLVGISGLVVVGGFLTAYNRRVVWLSNQLITEQGKMFDHIERVTRNWLLVRILRTSGREFCDLARILISSGSMRIKAGLFHNISIGVPNFFGVLLIGILFVLHENIPSQTSGTAFITFLYLFIRFAQSSALVSGEFSKIVSCYPQLKQAQDFFMGFSQVERASTLSELSALSYFGFAKDLSQESETRSVGAGDLAPALVIESLDFSYGGIEQAFIKSLSLLVKPGGQLGICGRSGSGKSTLLALILGVLPPSKGRVLIDGHSPELFLEKNLVGYVGVDPFLIAGTVRENLCYGQSESNLKDTELWDALKAAHLSEVISALDGGLSFRINEYGDGLSAGQKQRLSFARALVGKPRLLVLDEVSSSLDEETELEIIKTLEKLKGKVTTIIVSHREKMLTHADEVIDMSKLETS